MPLATPPYCMWHNNIVILPVSPPLSLSPLLSPAIKRGSNPCVVNSLLLHCLCNLCIPSYSRVYATSMCFIFSCAASQSSLSLSLWMQHYADMCNTILSATKCIVWQAAAFLLGPQAHLLLQSAVKCSHNLPPTGAECKTLRAR